MDCANGSTSIQCSMLCRFFYEVILMFISPSSSNLKQEAIFFFLEKLCFDRVGRWKKNRFRSRIQSNPSAWINARVNLRSEQNKSFLCLHQLAFSGKQLLWKNKHTHINNLWGIVDKVKLDKDGKGFGILLWSSMGLSSLSDILASFQPLFFLLFWLLFFYIIWEC